MNTGIIGSISEASVLKIWRMGLVSLAAVMSVGVASAAQAGTLTAIPSYVDPDGGRTSVLDINDAGWMTGSIGYADGSGNGFTRDAAGTYFTWNVDYFTQGRAIDNANTVTGYATDATQSLHTDIEFSRTNGGAVTVLQNPVTATDLHGIAQGMNSSGVIVGDYFVSGSIRHGYILDGATFTDLSVPGSPLARMAARGINDSGVVVGWANTGSTIEGFVWNAGLFTFFSNPNALSGTYFEDVNNSGLVAGEWSDASGLFHTFQFDINTSLFTEIAVAGATNAQAFGLNNAGQMVITTDITGGPNNFLYDPNGVPEPATWALMIMGFMGAGAMLRRARPTPVAVKA